MAQPRGGPMITGHESHQIGLDADIWLTPMPDRILTPQEREDLTATSMLKDPFIVDMKLWTPLQTRLIKRAASYPEVARIFVHPAIKRCSASKLARTRVGSPRCGRGGAITIISMCGSLAHLEALAAKSKSRSQVTMAVVPDSTTGSKSSSRRSCIRRNRAHQASRLLPSTTCRKNVEQSSIRLGTRL